MILLKMWRSNFSKSNFGLNHPFPYQFAMCVCQKKPKVTKGWLVYRGFLGIYFITTLLYSTSSFSEGEWFKHFIYLTYWTYILETIMFNVGFGVAVKLYVSQKNKTLQYVEMDDISRKSSKATRKSSEFGSKGSGRSSKPENDSTQEEGEGTSKSKSKKKLPEENQATQSELNVQAEKTREKKILSYLKLLKFKGVEENPQPQPEATVNEEKPVKETKLPNYLKFYWVLYNIVLSVSIGITFVFWILLYDPEVFPSVVKNIVLHFFNSLIIIFDFLLVAHPIKILHFYIPSIYGCVYMLFSMTYQLSGGTGSNGSIPIYKILDWRYPLKTVITGLLCILFVVFVHFVLAFLDLLKIPLKYRRRKSLEVV